MNAKKRYSLSAVLVLMSFASIPEPGIDYQKEFAGYYEDAIVLAEKIRPQLERCAVEFSEDPQVLEAIVFPELIRYNRFYDAIETGSLCALYSRFGSDYANFSIGYFQMKPGFAQSIEKFLHDHTNMESAGKLELGNFVQPENYDVRLDRVKRLQEMDWQIRYLIAFVKCCRLKHGTKESRKPIDNLLFLAAAYNSGWEVPGSVIKSKIHRKYFHLEHFNPAKKYSYADIVLYRYLQIVKSTDAGK